MLHSQIFARAFNTPLMVDPRKAQAFATGLGPRILGNVPMIVGGEEVLPEAVYRTSKPFASLLDRSLEERVRRGERQGYAIRDGIAVIPVTGVLVHRGGWIGNSSGQTSYEGLEAAFSAAADDPSVRGIAMEIDSFGGQVSGCFALCRLVADIASKMPVRAFVAESAYSAAYALASQADRIVLPETGGVGSIGVICMHTDVSAALEADGIKVTMIHAGSHKGDGNPYEPLPESVRDAMQADMEDLRLIFADAVASGRAGRLTAEGALATEAQCFRGEKAVSEGLADEVVTVRAAFDDYVSEIRGARPGFSSRRVNLDKQKGGTSMTQKQRDSVEDDINDDETETEEESETDDSEGSGDDMSAASARGDERKRISAIIGSPEAEGRETLARHLALETDMPAEAAAKVLEASGKSGGSNALEMAMEGNDTDLSDGPETPMPDASLSDILAKRYA